MIGEYSKVRIKSTGHVGVVAEFDARMRGTIHLVELTDTDDDARMVWVDSDDLEELP